MSFSSLSITLVLMS